MPWRAEATICGLPSRAPDRHATSTIFAFLRRPRARPRSGLADRNGRASVALYLADRSRRSQVSHPSGRRADARLQGGDGRHALCAEMGDQRADAQRFSRRAAIAGGADRRRRADRPLRRHARSHGFDPAGARRAVRRGGDERGASPRRRSLRSPPSIVAALSPRAQDRRTDADPRTRPQRHRDDHSHLDAGRRADDRRIRADRRRFSLFVRLALRAGDQRHGDGLSRLHHDRDQLAHRHPPLDERKRHRRQHQGDRQPVEFRDGEVFRRRTARGGALRQVDGALRAPQRQNLRFARGAERRPGDHLHRSA